MTRLHRTCPITVAAIVAVFLCAASAQAEKPDKPGGGGGGKGDDDNATRYSVIELPLEGRYSSISETDFSGIMTIAVNASNTGGTSAAFARVDSQSGEILSYGFLPEPTFVDPEGGSERDGPSNHTDVNSSGQVVGFAPTFDPTAMEDINPTRATFWDFDGTNYSMTRLSELPGSAGGSATGINSQGDIVGAMHTPGGNRAVYWDAATLTVADLNTNDTAALGWELGSAEDINDNGQIVGWGTLNEEVRGFVLDYATQEISAVPLVGPAHTNTAVQINNQGRVIGTMWDGEGNPWGLNPDFNAGFSWDESGVDPEILPSLTNNTSYTMGLNNADATVGNSVIPTDDPFAIYSAATLWEPDENGVIQAIDLANEIPNKPSYTLTSAYDINNDGWITARGQKRHKGSYTWPSLILMPNAYTGAVTTAFSSAAIPEPSTFALLFLGTIVVATRRRKASEISL